jgi:hypothetical protein
VIIFGKFGGGQAERNRTVLVYPAPEQRVDHIALVHSRRLTRASLASCPPSPFSVSEELGSNRIAVSLSGARLAGHLPRTPLSNRELDLLERHLSHCKQREATVSNRELSTVGNFTAPSALGCNPLTVSLHGPRIADHGTRPLAPFLTGSASQTEFVVTSRKQTIGKILTGARTAIKDSRFRAEFRAESHAQAEKECRSRDAAEQSKIPLHIRNEKEIL